MFTCFSNLMGLTPHARLVALLLIAFSALNLQAAERIEVLPAKVQLDGNFSRVQLVVREIAKDAGSERAKDLTHNAQYESSNPKIVTVDKSGFLLAGTDGEAMVTVTAAGQSAKVPVKVGNVKNSPDVDFMKHVMPVLSRAGCNMGACHASQYGKGGFVLSVFGFEPEKDREAIARDRQSRRVNLLDPDRSLFLLKPTMQVPHGGGKRLDKGSVDYQILSAWLKNGAPVPVKAAAKVTAIRVMPRRRLCGLNETQQLRVEADYSDGQTRDVTAWAKFDTLDDAVVGITPDGLATSLGRGQAPVMVRFMDQADMATFVVPFSDSVKLAGWKNQNFVDELASAKFQELGLEPSPLCEDATFLRRAFLDAIGTLPTPAQTREFLASKDPDKRNKIIDQLLGLTGDPALDVYNDQYAATWTLKWSDLIGNKSQTLGEQGMWALHNWIKESFRVNRPFDEFVRELVIAKGSIYSNGPANYFRINRTAEDLAESTAQLFLGVRLGCAKCHHHPFEKYSQADYYSFAAFFSRVGTKNSEDFGLFGRESVVLVKSSGSVKHPRTGKVMQPTPLEGEPITHDLDLRIPLAQWLTAKENKQFARSIVNRYAGYLLGRGLVEPIDDMRATNPPSNEELLNALTDKFQESHYDLKQLIRTIMRSRLYQLSSRPTPLNASDSKFYSHYKVKRISAEPLLDAVDAVTGLQTKFKNLPQGTRAIELPDAEYPNYFLTTFAKPRRASVCECERMPDENLAQALHTLNGDILAGKIADAKGRVAALLKAKKPHEEIVEELYLAALCRLPSEKEQAANYELLKQSASPQEFYRRPVMGADELQTVFVHPLKNPKKITSTSGRKGEQEA